MKRSKQTQWAFVITLGLALLATYGVVQLIDFIISMIRK